MDFINKVEHAFFKAKPMEDQNVQLSTPPTEEVPAPAAPEAPETPVDETPTEEVPAPTTREGYNCQTCKGEGLQDQFTLCPVCKGTGKL